VTDVVDAFPGFEPTASRLRLVPAIMTLVMLVLSMASAAAAPPGHVIRVGILKSFAPKFDPIADPFDRELVDGLRELGYVINRDIVFEFRSARDLAGEEALAQLTSELIATKIDLLLVPGTQPVLEAARVTKTVPIVMVGTADPVDTGLIASLARPGGNVTGLAVNAAEIAAKRVQLLRDAVPGLSRVAVLWNSSIKSMTLAFQNIEVASPKLGVALRSIRVTNSDQFDQAFAAIEDARPGGLIVLFGPLRGNDLPRIVQFVADHRIPTIFELGQGVRGGGLMEFGPSALRMARRAAAYIDKIANGADPASLPVEEPVAFQLVINLKAAAAIGVAIPQSLLLLADRVIE
jgi:putative tryptophan/tyrosine transport system substrate-binding protein